MDRQSTPQITTEKAARPLRFVDATLYIIVLVAGLNWVAVAATVGPGALPMWALAAVAFFVPLSVASAELAQRFKGEGGIYLWTRELLGPLTGFLCAWFYWFSLMPTFASMLFFLSGLIARLAGAGTSDPHVYLAISASIVVFVTAVELAGMRLGKWITNFGATGGWLAFGIAVVVALVLVLHGTTSTDLVHASYVPPLSSDTLLFWGTIVMAFAGPESIGFLRNELKGGSRTIVRALAVAGVAIAFIYIAGTAAFLVILPKAELTHLGGFPDAIGAGLKHIGLGMLTPAAIALLAASYLGAFAGWFGVGARLPLALGIDHFLPGLFARRNARTGAPTAAILLQAGVALAMVVMSQSGENVSGAYDILIAMGALTTALPYVFLFAAYMRFATSRPSGAQWRPPGGVRTSMALAILGMAGTSAAIACSMVPGSGEQHPLASFLKIVLPSLGMTVLGLLVFWSAWRRMNASTRLALESEQA